MQCRESPDTQDTLPPNLTWSKQNCLKILNTAHGHHDNHNNNLVSMYNAIPSLQGKKRLAFQSVVQKQDSSTTCEHKTIKTKTDNKVKSYRNHFTAQHLRPLPLYPKTLNLKDRLSEIESQAVCHQSHHHYINPLWSSAN